MRSEFRMPSLGPDMEAGTLVEWRTKPGDRVKRGDIVALIETDKGIIDVEIFLDGVIAKLLVAEGAQVPVGTPLAELETQEADAGAASTETQLPQPPAAHVDAPIAVPIVASTASSDALPTRLKVSPAARAHAHALGIDLTLVKGSGPGGAITIEDVARTDSNRRPQPSSEPEAAPRDRDMRQVIARAMQRSKREIPHYYLSTVCCFEKSRAWIERQNASMPIEQRLLPSALIVKAVALTARAMGDFNGWYKDETFLPADEVHVGMAIAMRGGRLAAPAILNADRKSLAAVMSELRDLTFRVRNGHMRAAELSMPTITLTSLGEDGVDTVIPAIYPPQVAIVGAGAIVERPWVDGGAVKPMPVLTLSLAADHRVTDGRGGSKFLSRIVSLLQTPERL